MAKVTDKESLFSLELVVEKLYIPHVACRFPAVAFRLLDFPTILVDHVEKELGDQIRRKISTDPYYNVPEQFSELKDKHGNFMMKKGKSCLFKIAVSSLKTHLSNTPLYVMVIDNFPKVSKLLGNCTVPLDEVMDLILNDIKTLGPTVPSVHGDKGLYKIYSLMGKEIGYIILGYRLLCLGPGLIPHIPESAIAKRMSTEVDQVYRQNIPQQRDVGSPSKRDVGGYSRRDEDPLMTTQEMGSMTDPEKHDVVLQTVNMCDKEIHVAISEPEVKPKPIEGKGIIVKDLHTIATQTFKRSKPKPVSELNGLGIKNADDDEDDVIVTNIAQPPPLFYNSEIEPAKKTERVYAYNDDEPSDEFLSEDEAESMAAKHKLERMKKEEEAKRKRQDYLRNQQSQAAKVTFMNHQQSPPQIKETGMGDQALFPLLTALMQEISNIQNPQLIQQTVQQVKSVSRTHQQQQHVPQSGRSTQQQKQIAPQQIEKENQSIEQAGPYGKQRGRKSHKTCAHPHDAIPGQKSWIRQAPQLGVKKSKLTYGLTNTQRLRLAKVNPDWAKSVDKEETDFKAQKQKLKKSIKEDQEFDTGNLSDTLTEVRRLAEKNLQDTLAEDSLLYGTMNSTSKSNRRRISPPRRKQKQSRKRSKSPRSTKQTSGKSSGDLQESKSIGQKSAEENLSDRDSPSLPSQRSIQVRIPSAQMYEDSDDENFSDFEQNAPTRNGRFPGFHDDNESLPDSIGADAMDNKFDHSFELKDDDFDQPLESTRNSKPSPPKAKKKWLSRKSPEDPSNVYNDDSFESDLSPRRDKADMPDKSRTFQSTEDYSTRQFQSTEEPELQRLMSSGERSELSDVMSSEKSARSPVPVTASMNSARFQVINPKASLQSPIPALRRSQVKLDTSMARPSPTGTPRSQTSSRFPTPKPRKVNPREKRTELKRESLHTESISSYVPSDGDFNPSLESDNFSDDFSSLSGREELRKVKELPRMLPSTKLGYTIH
ncbi:microtubule-associated protein 10-like [Ylistrum balloti]|uniref:microtubule-associated protein 10-like n=1 Tax=Ylistrum balloti TaxID=509963 RepID=UPI002905BA54|nr:microtubule-associated protein 10-like [Ylistrum balloti]